MPMLTRDRVAGAVIVLFSLYVLWEDRVLPLGTYHKPGPGYMPMILAVILGIAGVLIVLTAGGSLPLASVAWTEWRHALAILAGCAFTALALERLGYRLTVILLAGFLLSVVERRRPLTVIAMALVLSLGTFYVFYTLLRVPLPLGPGGF
jgi:putative tricarboxylic transport membrane protein